MAEANQLNSASAWLNQREPRSMGLGRSHLFTAVEAGLDPLVLVFSLWALAFYYEGSVRPAYLILSLIVFSLTFPGSSQLRLPVWKVFFKIAFHWIWIAGLLLLTGYVTEYFHKFSMTVLTHWLWVAPVAQAGAHLALRAAAPQLLKLQGPPRGAVIVGMQALAQGGGPTVRGSQNRLKLHRRDASGKVVEITPNLNDPIRPEDVLYVRESLF